MGAPAVAPAAFAIWPHNGPRADQTPIICVCPRSCWNENGEMGMHMVCRRQKCAIIMAILGQKCFNLLRT